MEELEPNSPAERIKWVRNKEGLNQQEFAVRIGVAQKTLSNWENGITVPGKRMLESLGETFGWSADWILTGNGESREEERHEEIKHGIEEVFQLNEENQKVINSKLDRVADGIENLTIQIRLLIQTLGKPKATGLTGWSLLAGADSGAFARK